MSADDKEYLRKHNIHKLLDSLAKDIIERKPDNPQQFVISWLKGKNTDQELAVQKIGKDTLAAWIQEGKNIVVADVSGVANGNKIKSAIGVEVDQVGAKSPQWQDKAAVVFYGPPEAAGQAAQALTRAFGSTSSTAIYVLSCTIDQWVASYGTDPALTSMADGGTS
eukprot:TRINITY_DN8458_c0_g1_i1.p1 TRINITY_DN8458_c0_g1~~TRINITY_DN8458_c0_g1_i1.p1  ORF type:complete len:185 (+),score=35.00 TRINITY_DN8458_c0_g1_i1:60-557(+)